MKRITSMLLVFVTALLSFVGCVGQDENSGKIKIVATLFPQYDFARIISGDKADVTMLLPYGAESHTYEPSVKDMTVVSSADVFLYTGAVMEPWAKNLIENSDSERIKVVDLSKGVRLLDGTDGEEYHEKNNDHTHDYDPHIWTSPKNALVMVEVMLETLCDIDPDNKDYYTKNAGQLKKEIESIDSELLEISERYDGTPLYFGGKFAFLYMFDAYGFNFRSPYKGCSDETEPSIKDISDICREIKEDGVVYIFCEEMSEGKVAKSVADETGTKLLVLHSCHNLSKSEAEKGESYVSIMKKNVENIRLAIER